MRHKLRARRHTTSWARLERSPDGGPCCTIPGAYPECPKAPKAVISSCAGQRPRPCSHHSPSAPCAVLGAVKMNMATFQQHAGKSSRSLLCKGARPASAHAQRPRNIISTHRHRTWSWVDRHGWSSERVSGQARVLCCVVLCRAMTMSLRCPGEMLECLTNNDIQSMARHRAAQSKLECSQALHSLPSAPKPARAR